MNWATPPRFARKRNRPRSAADRQFDLPSPTSFTHQLKATVRWRVRNKYSLVDHSPLIFTDPAICSYVYRQASRCLGGGREADGEEQGERRLETEHTTPSSPVTFYLLGFCPRRVCKCLHLKDRLGESHGRPGLVTGFSMKQKQRVPPQPQGLRHQA